MTKFICPALVEHSTITNAGTSIGRPNCICARLPRGTFHSSSPGSRTDTARHTRSNAIALALPPQRGRHVTVVAYNQIRPECAAPPHPNLLVRVGSTKLHLTTRVDPCSKAARSSATSKFDGARNRRLIHLPNVGDPAALANFLILHPSAGSTSRIYDLSQHYTCGWQVCQNGDTDSHRSLAWSRHALNDSLDKRLCPSPYREVTRFIL
jgi:hypothetical protein